MGASFRVAPSFAVTDKTGEVDSETVKVILGLNINFLGHKLGQGNLQTDCDKVDRILNAPNPRTKKDVRAFIGLAGYYRKFIPNFAAMVTPLTEAARKESSNVVQWRAEQQGAFDTLKGLFSEDPVLKLPNFDQVLVLRTVASIVGIGAILLQSYGE